MPNLLFNYLKTRGLNVSRRIGCGANYRQFYRVFTEPKNPRQPILNSVI